MEAATIVLGMIVAVTVLVLFSSGRRVRTQGLPGPQGQSGPGQGLWPQQPGPNRPPQQPSAYQGNPGGSYVGRESRDGGGVLQFFAIVGVLVIIGACGMIILALQTGIQ